MKIHTNREFYSSEFDDYGDGKTHKRIICSIVNMTPQMVWLTIIFQYVCIAEPAIFAYFCRPLEMSK